MTFGKELIQSAKEALAIAEGRAEPAAVYEGDELLAAAQEDAERARAKIKKAD